jgi:hypothetical protein
MQYNVRMSTLPRELSDTPKLQAQSCPEIADWVKSEATRLARRGVKWRRSGTGPLLNFIVAWYQTQSKEDRERIAREGLAKLTDILNHEYIEPDDAPEVAKKPKVSGTVNPRGGSAKKLPNHRNSEQPVSNDATVVLH